MTSATVRWIALAVAVALGAAPAGAEEAREAALARLDARLATAPEDLAALAERARIREEAGLSMAAFLDRREILRLAPHAPGAGDVARIAAYNLAAAGAPEAALRFVERYPAAAAGEAGEAMLRHVTGDVAGRRVRWGWHEPVFSPAERQHEAEIAIAALEAARARDPEAWRPARDLLLAYRLGGRMADAIAIWESKVRTDDAAYWLRNAAADAYLAERRPAVAEKLYRSIGDERPDASEPWLGLYWTGVEQKHWDDAAAALDRLRAISGHELTADVQAGWLLLFQDRTEAARDHFQALFERYPADPRVREALATTDFWQGYPRQGLAGIEELLARTTSASPPVDHASARIARAGGLSSLGDLGRARREAEDLAARYPENPHAVRLLRDVQSMLSPEARLDARYDTSDRGLGESWAHVEGNVAVGPRARLAVGGWMSRAEDDRYTAGDVRDAYLGLSVRPSHWLALSGEVTVDLAEEDLDRDPAYAARFALMPDDHWRLDAGFSHGGWRDLSVRARAIGVTGDSYDLGLSYRAGPRWDVRVAGGYSELSDDNERTYGLVGAQWLVLQGPVYRASFGAELYGSENTRQDVPYYSPIEDRSASITHRSEWVTLNVTGRRHTFSILAHVGTYDQEGYDSGPVGGVWLQSDLDLPATQSVLVVGAGARSQLYDGNRELDPRVYVTVRQRF